MKKKEDGAQERFLRDFIYLDVALVGSYLEQLVGGVPHEAQVSHEYRDDDKAGVNVSLFHLDLQGGSTRGYAENQTIYWARYDRLENELRSAGKLVELKGSDRLAVAIQPGVLFLYAGAVSFAPDWSNWHSGISLAKLIVEKLRQMNALESDVNGMVPMLVGPGGSAIITLRKDALSQVIPNDLPEEPPGNIRRLFKPLRVKVASRVATSSGQVTLEGGASL